MKYYVEISKITNLRIKNFPNEFPMFMKATTASLDKYNKLMLKCISNGFDPRTRKVCFTLNCTEGLNHEEVYNTAKELPEVTKEQYEQLSEIPHWDPIASATTVLENFMELIEAVADSDEVQELSDQITQSFEKQQEESEIHMVS